MTDAIDIGPKQMHGIHCVTCNYLFDGFAAPLPIVDAIERMKTARCPKCSRRKSLLLLMPWKYEEMKREAATVSSV